MTIDQRLRAAILIVALWNLSGTPSSGTPQAVSPKGSIEGIVIGTDTGEPLAGARVILVELSPAAAAAPDKLVTAVSKGGEILVVPDAAIALTGGLETIGLEIPGALPAVATDRDGKFSFQNLAPGTYRLIASKNDYVRQEYGQRAGVGVGRPLYLAAGQTIQDVSIKLAPTGVVSGRIFESSGRPAIGIPVRLLRSAYNAEGRVFRTVGTATANDRGEYRVYDVPPGHYYLGAGTPGMPAGSASAPSRVPGASPVANYAMTYYPGVADLSEAKPIEVPPRSEVKMDLITQRQPVYRIRGRIINSTSADPLPASSVQLGYRSVSGAGLLSRGANPTGVFEFQDLNPGSYTIRAQSGGPQLGQNPDLASALLTVKVVDANVDGIVLTLTTGVTVSGEIRLEGQPLSTLPDLERIRLNLRVANPVAPTPTQVSQPPDSDGLFRVVELREGEYSVRVSGVPQGYYVHRVLFSGADILRKSFKFSGSEAGKFEVTLGRGTGQIGGAVTGPQSEPAQGVQVVLVPEQRSRTDLYRSLLTDRDGRFVMAGITPGAYKLFSWESLEQGGYFDPEILKQYEEQGRSVRVAESSSEMADIRLIPVP